MQLNLLYPYFLKRHMEKWNCWIEGYALKIFKVDFAKLPLRAVIHFELPTIYFKNNPYVGFYVCGYMKLKNNEKSMFLESGLTTISF